MGIEKGGFSPAGEIFLARPLKARPKTHGGEVLPRKGKGRSVQGREKFLPEPRKGSEGDGSPCENQGFGSGFIRGTKTVAGARVGGDRLGKN